ncbi:MAG: adenylate/guanylate cyclase domain-containing protein [Gaiellaceae bacterium]
MSENPPSGAVTFLFTDIEGSTRLVKQLRDGYERVLAEHQELLRSAFSAHRGFEVDTQGDAFFVAFPAARDAVLAAVGGQLSLLSHQWPEGAQVDVRMGVHTGQATEKDGKYTGLAVHRAARICAAAHGRQILVSQATQTLLEDEEEDLDISLSELGEHQLKDLDRPARLYQVGAKGLPARFPPVRPSDSAKAAESPAAPPQRRRMALVLAALVAVAVVAAGALFLLTSGSHGGVVPPNHVGVIDPETNTVVASIPVGADPGPVATGAGSLWVGNGADRTITRISLDRRVPVATLALDGRTPTGIAFGGGAVWIAHGARGEVSRIDLHTNRLSKTIQDVADPGSNYGAVTVTGDSVWAVYGDSTLARIDAKTTRVSDSTFAGNSPRGVVVADGGVWVLNAGNRTVTHFAPKAIEGGAVGRPIPVGHRPVAIAAGEGAIWVADAGDDAVTRIDPSTKATTRIRVGREPSALAVGGGLVWVANAGSGTVSRIDPVSNQLAGTIKVGNMPSGIAFGGNFVWVTVDASGG